jgi:2-keto-4-pentenoate hydratase/2-oxohepta-3-ene-1,7-dioic acid hydratase in catechol pathway
MREFGRFRKDGREFYGECLGEQVDEWSGAPWLGGGEVGVRHVADELVILTPCEPGKIIAVGRNFAEHAAEQDAETPAEPIIWLKAPSSLTPHRSMVAIPHPEHRTDYEAELAVVIGRRARRVSVSEANSYVFGYTAAQDISDRVLQRRDGQWTRAKSFDTFTPLGPTVRTGLDLAGARVRQYWNGVLKQDGAVAGMVFSIPDLLAFISDAMTLEPGDVILTGTPAGVGPIRPGDHLEVQIDGLAPLANNVGMRGSA